ncbi:MAG: cytochrome d ubiquinol oxidase subunit II [Flavobacteriaceae bacterium]|jgi:TRAP-type uncharacterized transport system fused permease subunit|nr:cytochrome d ubiquinol oxidase subunit II [Flavobacteriaceae bacterium]
MGKNFFILVLLQAVLALTSAFLIAQMSFIGRIGISLFYRQYQVFKSPWKTAALLFAVQLLILLILWSIKRFGSNKLANTVAIIFLAIAIVGAIYTYLDFTTTSHKYMKTKFHVGWYVFWGSWMLTSITTLFMKHKKPILEETNIN